LIAAFAVLPGALYTWTFEQQAGRWGATATDRIQRFLGASAIFLVVELPLLYELYRVLVVPRLIQQGKPLPWWSWLAAVGLIAIPIIAGRLIGLAAYRRKRWVAAVLTGPSPAPRAWDDLFATPKLTGWIILRLKNDDENKWVGGLWGESVTGLKSYAAGYPETQDLLIADLAEMDDNGFFLVGEDGAPSLTGVSLLVRWDEVAYAKFTPG